MFLTGKHALRLPELKYEAHFRPSTNVQGYFKKTQKVVHISSLYGTGVLRLFEKIVLVLRKFYL